MGQRKEVISELVTRELEKRHTKERESLVEFIQFFFKQELNKPFQVNWHHRLIEEYLLKALNGEINRLIINIPPGAGKTELITKCFPVWVMGNRPETEIIATGYSATLTQNYGAQARDYYKSDTFKQVFPRRTSVRQDQDTKGLWKNESGGQYLATGTGGSITGNRANIFLIDDPIKPDDAMSDVKREAINQWYDNTVLSRLYNADKDIVVIVMQRVHENDLCGYLLDKMDQGTGEKWTVLSIPAISYAADEHRGANESYHAERIPLSALEKIRSNNQETFSTQYQQEPISKQTQEFHEEFFRYFEEEPKRLRIFTVIDPAFKLKEYNDETAIVTGGFIDDKLYILEITHGRMEASKVIEAVVEHARKWTPEKIGIEGVAAQTVMAQFLRSRMNELGIYIPIDEITQKGDKISKIRGLQGPIRYGKILWRKSEAALELQLKKFPKGKHDDIIDGVQMLYYFYKIQPSTDIGEYNINIDYDHMGRPVFR